MTAETPESMARVTAARPCPVCGKPDWCLAAPDGSAAICARVESGRRCGEAGWLHRLTEPPPRPPARKFAPENGTGTPPPGSWLHRAEGYAADLTAACRAKAEADLGLPPGALDRLPLVGSSPAGISPAFLTFPQEDGAGNVVGVLRRYAGGEKRHLPGGKAGLCVPAGWADAPGAVHLVEGATDCLAMAAAGLAAVGRPSNAGGVAHLTMLLKAVPAGRPVVVVGENDAKPDGTWPGRAGAAATARRLAAALGRPVTWSLPPDGAKDARAWLTDARVGGLAWAERGALLAAALAAGDLGACDPATGAESRGGPAAIVIGTDEHRVNDEAVIALAGEPGVYERGGLLVQVIDSPDPAAEAAAVRRPPGLPVLRPLPKATLRELLTARASWQKVNREGEAGPAHPPAWCVDAVLDRGTWPGLRRLEAVLPYPVVRADGGVLAASGYDPATGLLVRLPRGLAIDVPDRPTPDDIRRAVGTLGDAVADFPFEAPAHRAAWVAGLLTPLAWFAFDGPAPLFLIDKNVRGAGAGLLADVVALTLTGRRFPVMSYTPDRVELRKRITSLAVEGERMVLLDNLAGPVGNDVLDAALTATSWKDRVLGGNRNYDGPLNVVWYATGNNVQMQADTSRRTCPIRMESAEERPELRTGFRHPDLRAHVRASRGPLLGAALTLLRGYFAAGRPRHGLPAWGSFEGWSGVVREAVVFAGLPDPGDAREALLTAADRDAAAVAAVIRLMEALDPGGRGLTAGELIDRAKPPHADDLGRDLREAVEALCGKLDSRALAGRFQHFARRNFGGRMLDKGGADRTKTSRWVVLRAGARPAAGDAGDAGPIPTRPTPADATAHAGDAGDAGGVPTPRLRRKRRYRNDDRPIDARHSEDA